MFVLVASCNEAKEAGHGPPRRPIASNNPPPSDLVRHTILPPSLHSIHAFFLRCRAARQIGQDKKERGEGRLPPSALFLFPSFPS